jgi:TetR/AcrR family transcriptional regulator, mexJK operon transcriptional repressor
MEKAAVKKKRRVGPGRPSAADALLVEQRVLDAATELFLEDGYDATTMEGIARKAGASTKTLYSRYANKSEILAAVAQHILNRPLSEPSPAAPEVDGADPLPFIQKAAHELAFLYLEAEPAKIMRLALSEGYRHPEVAQFFRENHQRVIERIAEALERWQRAGKLPHLGHPQITAAMFIEMAASVARLRGILGQAMGRKEIQIYVDTAVDIFLRGLGYKASTGKAP